MNINYKLQVVRNNMMARCYRPTDKDYKNYGGRGITVCEEWRTSLNAFWVWARNNGYKPWLRLERINNDLGYSPDNCRWATTREQANNRSTNALVEAFGETKTLVEWSRDPRCAVSYETLQTRYLKQGLRGETLIATPVQRLKRANAVVNATIGNCNG